MTRINLVPVAELSDQHVFAEWRELPRMASYASKANPTSRPSKFTLGTGHMVFFLDKASWLESRHRELTTEVLRRGYKLNNLTPFVMSRRFGDVLYTPSQEEVEISRQRINQRLAEKPEFYTFNR